MSARHAVLVLALLAPGASASTFTIDDDGPADFADLPEAFSSALVQDGDVLLVEPGIYTAAWTLEKALTIRGTGQAPGDVFLASAFAGPDARVRDLPAGSTATLSNLRYQKLSVENCAGTVVLSDLRGGFLSLADSSDVRVSDLNYAFNTQSTLALTSSHAEVLRARFEGGDATGGFGSGEGGSGITVDASSSLVLASSTSEGGRGGNSGILSFDGGPGGPGIRVFGSVRILGPGTTLTGGIGGLGEFVSADGPGGPAIYAGPGANVRYSRAQLVPGTTPFTLEPGVELEDDGATIVAPASPDPALLPLHAPVAGTGFEMRSHGADGAFAAVYVGLQPLVLPLPGFEGTLCTSALKFVGSGFMDAGANVFVSVFLPTDLPPSTVVHFQSLTIYPGQEDYRFSNCLAAAIP